MEAGLVRISSSRSWCRARPRAARRWRSAPRAAGCSPLASRVDAGLLGRRAQHVWPSVAGLTGRVSVTKPCAIGAASRDPEKHEPRARAPRASLLAGLASRSSTGSSRKEHACFSHSAAEKAAGRPGSRNRGSRPSGRLRDRAPREKKKSRCTKMTLRSREEARKIAHTRDLEGSGLTGAAEKFAQAPAQPRHRYTIPPASRRDGPADPTTRPSSPPISTDCAADATDRAAEPTDRPAEPADGSAKPADRAADPTDRAVNPSDGAAEPTEGAADAADGATQPADRAAKPAEASEAAHGVAEAIDRAASPPTVFVRVLPILPTVFVSVLPSVPRGPAGCVRRPRTPPTSVSPRPSVSIRRTRVSAVTSVRWS